LSIIRPLGQLQQFALPSKPMAPIKPMTAPIKPLDPIELMATIKPRAPIELMASIKQKAATIEPIAPTEPKSALIKLTADCSNCPPPVSRVPFNHHVSSMLSFIQLIAASQLIAII
jgi:hypothetical protein